MPVVVRRMGGSPTDVAIVVGAPFIGHMLAPFFTLLLSRIRPVRVGASVAGIASAAVAGVFIDSVPVQWVFLAAALIALPGSMAFFRIEYDRPMVAPKTHPIGVIVRDVWSDRRYRQLLLAFLVFGWGNLMNFAVFPIMLVDHFDAPNTFVGIFSAVQSATMVVA